MFNTAFESWPSFTKQEADAVSQVLLSNKVNYWTRQESREFEKEFPQFAETQDAVVLANRMVTFDAVLKNLALEPGVM